MLTLVVPVGRAEVDQQYADLAERHLGVVRRQVRCNGLDSDAINLVHTAFHKCKYANLKTLLPEKTGFPAGAAKHTRHWANGADLILNMRCVHASFNNRPHNLQGNG